MQLETKSERGAIVNALNTFSMTFTAGDTATLQAAVVPETDFRDAVLDRTRSARLGNEVKQNVRRAEPMFGHSRVNRISMNLVCVMCALYWSSL